MNARQPLFLGPTASPCADAERYENDREANDEWSQEAARQAPLIILKQLQDTAPADWFKSRIGAGRNWSADEIIIDAVASDPDSASALAELMTSPAAQKLRQLAAHWFAGIHHLQIFAEYQEDLSR